MTISVDNCELDSTELSFLGNEIIRCSTKPCNDILPVIFDCPVVLTPKARVTFWKQLSRLCFGAVKYQTVNAGTIICDISRPLVHCTHQLLVSDNLHRRSNTKLLAGLRLVGARHVCLSVLVFGLLRRSKVHRHVASPFMFIHIHINIVGSLTLSCGFTLWLMWIDM